MAEIEASSSRIGATLFRSLLADAYATVGAADEARRQLEVARDDAERRGERFWLPHTLRRRAELERAS